MFGFEPQACPPLFTEPDTKVDRRLLVLELSLRAKGVRTREAAQMKE